MASEEYRRRICKAVVARMVAVRLRPSWSLTVTSNSSWRSFAIRAAPAGGIYVERSCGDHGVAGPRTRFATSFLGCCGWNVGIARRWQ